MSKLSPDANKALFAAGVDLYKSFGYTTAQEGKASVDSVATMAAVAESGKLDIDVVAYPDISVGADAMKAPWLSRTYSGASESVASSSLSTVHRRERRHG